MQPPRRLKLFQDLDKAGQMTTSTASSRDEDGIRRTLEPDWVADGLLFEPAEGAIGQFARRERASVSTTWLRVSVSC